MSNKDLARRTAAEISFAGVNITKSIRPYLLSLSYTDNEEGEADDLQLTLQDREGIWLESWLAEAVEAAAAARLKIQAVLVQENWQGGGQDRLLDCGIFELDSVTAQSPPGLVTIKGTSLPYSAQIRQTLRTKAWEAYNLSGIARQLAAESGLGLMYEAAADPFYPRVEQAQTSDIVFLSGLCRQAGISLKATGDLLVLFDQAAYEQRPSVYTIKRGSGVYTKYKLAANTADSQYASCRVSYVDPATGKCLEGVAQAKEVTGSSQQLEIKAKVASVAEAKALAEKQLRLHNKYAHTVSITLPGNPQLAAGLCVRLADFGGWSGKYMIKQAQHNLSASGYTTQIELRKVLEGY